MQRFCLLLALTTTLLSAAATAETLTAGKRYQGKTTLEVPAFELSFELPKGYVGMQPPGGEWFHVGKDDEVGRIFMWATRATTAEANATMSSMFPVAGALMLQPTGEVRSDDNELAADYTATDGVNQYQAHVRTIVKNNVAVAVVAVAPSESLDSLKALSKRLASSLKFGVKPKAPKAGNVGNGAWAAELADKHVVRYYHGSGYSEKKEFWLCANGSFHNSFNATSNSQLGTGVANDGAAGRWSVTGNTLKLQWSDGSASEHALENRDGKLFVDGERWLREAGACR